jgi:hypothetical protein
MVELGELVFQSTDHIHYLNDNILPDQEHSAPFHRQRFGQQKVTTASTVSYCVVHGRDGGRKYKKSVVDCRLL